MRTLTLVLLLTLISSQAFSQFTVSSNHHFIEKDGKPFFWLGDTAWELFHRLNREDAEKYFKKRSEQGFTVVQAVVLAEIDGLHKPNAYGQIPFVNDNPSMPNEKYFEHVDYIINLADKYHINIAMLPTWGDKVFKDKWGMGPELFNEKNIALYGTWIARRYKDRTNIIWIIGGDRNPRNDQDVAIWRSMANAIQNETGYSALMSYHPQPNQLGAGQWFNDDKWLSFNMFQNGHCRDGAIYDKIFASYNRQPLRPVLDGEPIYEDHPVCFNPNDLGISNAYDVRKYAYLDLFAGAFGHTYGCHDVWQMYAADREAINGAHIYWHEAINLPGANQMQYVRKLVESHPILDRIPDQSLIKENNNSPAERIQATRGKDYLFVYTAAGKPFNVFLDKIEVRGFQAYWYNPRNGKTIDIQVPSNLLEMSFTPPSTGYGQDWILVVDDAAKKYPKP
ncbi:glycoside hydrolase family 140 protein [soil metagenome]